MSGQRVFFFLAVVFTALRWSKALKLLEPNYRPEFEGMEMHNNISNEYYEFHSGRIGLLQGSANRTIVLNANFTLKKDLPKSAWVVVTAYERKANRDYSMIPVKLFTGKWCDLVRNEPYVYRDLEKYTNYDGHCPPLKAFYMLRDYHIKASTLAPELPGERWKLDLTLKTSRRGKVVWYWTLYIYLNRNF